VLHTGQLRAVERAARFRPGARRRMFILDGADTMRWDIANIFLKILEEPPPTTTLILLAPSKYNLLPTIISRCIQFEFAPLPDEQMESLLKAHTKLDAASRARAAEMAEGSPGAAIGMDVERMFELRKQALKLLQLAATEKLSLLFGLTNQITKKDAVPFESLLDALYSVLADLLELTSRKTGIELRNPGLRKEMQELAGIVDTAWVALAVRGVDRLAAGQRRNLNRQLGLDSLGLSLPAR
jgi:DNA polymerase-3 subunit delta'